MRNFSLKEILKPKLKVEVKWSQKAWDTKKEWFLKGSVNKKMSMNVVWKKWSVHKEAYNLVYIPSFL